MVCCRLLKKEEETDLKSGGNERWFQNFTTSSFWHQAAESEFFWKVKLWACLGKPIKDNGHVFKSGTRKLLARGARMCFPSSWPRTTEANWRRAEVAGLLRLQESRISKACLLGLKVHFSSRIEFKASLKLQAELKAVVVSPRFYTEPAEVWGI